MNVKDHIAPIICIAGLMLMLCTAPRAETRTIALPAEASDGQQARLLPIVNEHNTFLPDQVKWTLLPKGSAADWPISFDVKLMRGRHSACETHSMPRRIVCDLSRSASCSFSWLMSHELLHAIGMAHRPGGIMDPVCSGHYQGVDPETIAEVGRHYRPVINADQVVILGRTQ